MIRSVIQSRFYTDHRISGKRPFKNRFLQSFFYIREIVFRNRSADYARFKYIRCIKIVRRFKFHLNVSVLSVAAGLFLIFHIYIRIFADRFAECNFRCLKRDLHFISRRKFACCDLEMLISHSIEKRLTVLTVIYRLQSNILCRHFCKRL